MKVTGDLQMKLYLRDGTYQGWKKPGITKAGIPTEIKVEED